MGELGRERVWKEFSLKSTLSAYEKLYREAIGRGNPEQSTRSSRS